MATWDKNWYLHLPDNDGLSGQARSGSLSRVLGAGHVAGLHGQDDGVHQVLGRLDQGCGRVQSGYDELTGDVLNVSFDLN